VDLQVCDKYHAVHTLETLKIWNEVFRVAETGTIGDRVLLIALGGFSLCRDTTKLAGHDWCKKFTCAFSAWSSSPQPSSGDSEVKNCCKCDGAVLIQDLDVCTEGYVEGI
jgi:hypothetical protein